MGLLEEVLEAHGGRDAWLRAERVRLRARSGGLLLRTRAPRGAFEEVDLDVEIGSVRATASPYPRSGLRGVFADGSVRIEAGDGEVLASRQDPRRCFFGRPGLRRNLRWDALDLVYFAGYAWWNYLNHPVLLCRDGVAVSEAGSLRRGGQIWRWLDVSFPPGLHTHSPRQSFLYDEELRLRRHDYVAEVVGRWARAAHICDGHREVDGLLFPTRRRVHPLAPGGSVLPGPVLVALDLAAIEVVSRPASDRPPPAPEESG
jgi:hypothetical protein